MTDQAAFRAAMLDPGAQVPAGLINPGGKPAQKRFDVYRNNVAVSLTEALIAAFPVIYKLVGDEFFRAMAGVFLRLHPPKSPVMMFYGEAMPKFLRRFGPAQSLPYLHDVALVELAMRQAYHAADAAPLPADKLGALTPDALMAARFRFAPAVQVIASSHPVHAIYRANTESNAPAVVRKPETVMISRPQFDPKVHLLEPAATAFVTSLQNGDTLSVAAATAGNGLDLGATLGLLLASGALTNMY